MAERASQRHEDRQPPVKLHMHNTHMKGNTVKVLRGHARSVLARYNRSWRMSVDGRRSSYHIGKWISRRRGRNTRSQYPLAYRTPAQIAVNSASPDDSH
jgi:hypothetical protein